MIGTLLAGRYRILRAIGEGGAARVYAAADEEYAAAAHGVKREVAVKMLRSPLPEAGRLADATDEFHLLATLSHPGLVTVFDIGEYQRHPYFVAELLPGRTLAQLRADGLFPPGALTDAASGGERRDHDLGLIGDTETVLDVLARIATVLDFLHSLGFVHRDLKPANVMVLPGGQVKVMDFGLVHALARTGVEVEAGAGTAPYMAPEQIQGGDVDTGADLYSLGCVAYELLTGRTPFAAERLGDVVVGHLTRAPRPVRELAPRTPPNLDALVMRLLAKHRDDRPATALEVQRAIFACLPAARALGDAPLPPAMAALRARHDLARAAMWGAEYDALDAATADLRAGRGGRVIVQGDDAAEILRSWRTRHRGERLTVIEVRTDGRRADSPITEVARKIAALRAVLAAGGAVTPMPADDDLVAGLRDLARVQPVILCLEDLGFAHADAVRRLSAIAAQIHDVPVGLWATVRMACGVPWPCASDTGSAVREWSTGARVLPPRSLEPGEIAEVARVQLGAALDGTALIDALAATTPGTAAAVQATLAALCTGGVLVRRLDHWVWKRGASLASQIQAAAATTFAALPPLAQEVLTRAAVLGAGPWPRSLLRNDTEIVLLCDRGWLRQAESARGPVLSFVQPLWPRAHVALLPDDERARLEGAASAAWAAEGDDAAPALAARAQHLVAAGRAEEAWPLALRAARAAAAVQALPEALDLCLLARRALDTWSATAPPTRALDEAALDLLRTQRRLLLLAGRPREARGLAEDVLARARALQLPGDEALALNDLGVTLWRGGDPRAGGEYLASALELWTALGDNASRARALVNLGEIHRQTGDWRASIACDRDAIRAGLQRGADNQPASRNDALRALMHLGNTWQGRGNFAAARRCYARAATGWHAAGHEIDRARALHNLALVHASMAHIAASIRAYRASLDLFERGGASLEEAFARANLSEVLLDAGEWDEASGAALHSLAAAERAGDESLAVRARCLHLRWALATADGKAIAGHLAALDGAEERISDSEDALALRLTLADAWLALGDRARAAALTAPLREPRFAALREAAPRIARALVLSGSADVAPWRSVALLERAARTSRTHGDRRDLLRLGLVLGHTLLAAGDVAAGQDVLARVWASASRTGLRPLAAAAALACARWDRTTPRVSAQRASDAATSGGTADIVAEAALNRAEAELGEGLASLAWACARTAVRGIHAAWSSLPDEDLRRLYGQRRDRFVQRLRSVVSRLAAHPDVRTWAGESSVAEVIAQLRALAPTDGAG